LADEDEREGSTLPSPTEWIKERTPEPGVTYFSIFVLAILTGFLLAVAGWLRLAMAMFLVAIISILAMLFTPSPAAKARRAARSAPDTDEDVEDGEGAEGEDEVTRDDLSVYGAPAPTAARRDVPAPPPEPPPMEDIVIDLDGGSTDDEAPAVRTDNNDTVVED
jgi:hypothetical protein